MGMFLLLLGLSLVLTALQGVMLAYLWRESQTPAPPVIDITDVVGPPQFFQASLGRSGQAVHHSPHAPLLLLQRLEQHIRLEQAAAESFHQFPTAASLHRHTASPLLH